MSSDVPVSVTFALRGDGWTDIGVKIGDSEFVMDWISYCSDAFGEMFRAAAAIALGAPAAVCSFDCEPAEWRLLASSKWSAATNSTELHLEIFETESWGRDPPSPLGELHFRGECVPDAFSRAVLQAGKEMLDTVGEDGFQTRWLMPFPRQAYEALAAALN